jgi:cytochrome c peroxidase
MQRETLRKVLSIGCLTGLAGLAAVLGILGVPRGAFAQQPYNPYPFGILPADLDVEIARVQREVQTVYNRYLAEWRAMSPTPHYSGQPPILEPNGYEAQRILGGLLNFDSKISPFQNVACAFCHMPYVAFSGPIQSVNLTMVAYPGTFHYRAAKRTAQRYTYSHTFPVLNYNAVQGLFFGGNFWDGRATGYKLQTPDAEQAQFPPVDPLEMGFPDTACIAYRLSSAVYRPLFELVWGADFDIQWPSDTAAICATPEGAAKFGGSATPIPLTPDDRTKATNIYDHWGQSL